MIHNLSDCIKTFPVLLDGSAYTAAAGTTDLTSEAIDTLGYSTLRVLITFGAITSGAVTSVKLQHSTASGSGYTDVAGSTVTVADDDDSQTVIYDVFHPRYRYFKTVIDRGTQNAVVLDVKAELFNALNAPVTQDAARIQSTTKLVSPA